MSKCFFKLEREITGLVKVGEKKTIPICGYYILKIEVKDSPFSCLKTYFWGVRLYFMLQTLSYSELLWFLLQRQHKITNTTLSLGLICLCKTKCNVQHTTLNSL